MSEEDTAMADPEESLVTRRSRRSTAGNRMEAALAEMALDTTAEAPEDDQDFVNDKDEEDMFGSDFESTDEETAQNDVDTGDRIVQEEEEQARKDARSRVERATALAHARQKVTFNPQAATSSSTLKPRKANRRVSLGAAVNAETGEVLPVGLPSSSPKKKRHSQRKHTILNTSATVTRMKQSEQKKAATPKKAKVDYKIYTQAELIALALDNEEGNIVEHRDYLRVEEEKRRRARVVRATVNGPLIRWVSKSEEVKVIVPPPPAPMFQPARATYTYAPYNVPGSTAYGQTTPYYYSAGVYPHMAGGSYLGSSSSSTPSVPVAPISLATSTVSIGNPASNLASTSTPTPTSPTPQQCAPQTPTPSVSQLSTQSETASTSLEAPHTIDQVVSQHNSQPTTQPVAISQLTPQSAPQPTSQQTGQSTLQMSSQSTSHPVPQSVSQLQALPAAQQVPQSNPYHSAYYNPYMVQLQQPSAPGAIHMWTPPLPPQPVERTEKVTKNYVVHELSQYEGTPKPPWNETMAAMFGDHVQWDELKVYVGKGRPLARPKQTCPITGKEAKYLDPRTGVPYADIRAYDVLTRLLDHKFAWSSGLGRYTGSDYPV